MPDKKPNIKEQLAELEKLAEWFESDSDFDVEEGLEKVKDEHPEQEGMTLEEALKIISG